MNADPHPVFAWLATQLHTLSPTDLWLVGGSLLLLRASSRLGMWPYALLAMPGTLAHELAHYLVALLLGASPSFPSLTPQRAAGGWRLGSVTFRAGVVRALPIALAPFALLPLSLWWAASLMAPADGALYFMHAWIVAALVSASLPSSADFKLALPALGVLAVAALAYAYLT